MHSKHTPSSSSVLLAYIVSLTLHFLLSPFSLFTFSPTCHFSLYHSSPLTLSTTSHSSLPPSSLPAGCRALEASLAERQGGLHQMGLSLTGISVDPLNPHERKRQARNPVGLKNIGNTCWFSAVIQVCIQYMYMYMYEACGY